MLLSCEQISAASCRTIWSEVDACFPDCLEVILLEAYVGINNKTQMLKFPQNGNLSAEDIHLRIGIPRSKLLPRPTKARGESTRRISQCSARPVGAQAQQCCPAMASVTGEAGEAGEVGEVGEVGPLSGAGGGFAYLA